MLAAQPHLPLMLNFLLTAAVTVVVLILVHRLLPIIAFSTLLMAGIPAFLFWAQAARRKWETREHDRDAVAGYITLEGRDLSNRDLTSIRLFEREDLTSLTAHKTNLRHAVLIRATMPKSSLTGSDLSYADLTEVNCARSRFFRTKLVGAKLDGVWAPGASFDQADLRDASLIDANLYRASFTGADVRGADFTGARIDADALAGARRNAETVMPQGHRARPSDQPTSALIGDLADRLRTSLGAAMGPGFIAFVSGIFVIVAVTGGRGVADGRGFDTASGGFIRSSPVDEMPSLSDDVAVTRTTASDVATTRVEVLGTTQTRGEQPISTDPAVEPVDGTSSDAASGSTTVPVATDGAGVSESADSTTDSGPGSLEVVMGTVGGSSLAAYASEVGDDTLEIDREYRRRFFSGPTSGSIRIEVSPRTSSTTSMCAIVIDGVERVRRVGETGRPVICELAVDQG